MEFLYDSGTAVKILQTKNFWSAERESVSKYYAKWQFLKALVAKQENFDALASTYFTSEIWKQQELK